MKYIKTYENLNDAQIGDYVICTPKNMIANSENFFNSTVGILLKKSEEYCGVEYENIPDFISSYYCSWRQRIDGTQYRENIIWFTNEMITYHSKSKEETELKKSTDKYNL